MIKLLTELQDAIELDDITTEMWNEWQNQPITKHFYQFIKGESVKSMDCLVEDDRAEFCRGELNAYDQTLNYIPRNVDV